MINLLNGLQIIKRIAMLIRLFDQLNIFFII